MTNDVIPNIIEREQTLLSHDVDAFGCWRPDAIFRFMQEIASEHLEKLGVSHAEMLGGMGYIWMLARVDLQILKFPKLYESIHARTWYGMPGRTTFPRYIEINDQNGEPAVNLATSWIIVDVNTRRILSPEKVGVDFPDAADLTHALPEPKKQRLLRTGNTRSISRTPRYCDLDVNGHMNNASYVSWVLDLFPFSHYRGHQLESLYISYASEAKPDELVNMTVYEENHAFEIQGKSAEDEHTIFEVTGRWKVKQMEEDK